MELIANYLQNLDSGVAFALFSGITCAVFIIGLLLATKLKSGKTFTTTELRKSQEIDNDTITLRLPEQNCLRNNSISGGKQSRLRRINNRKGLKNKNTLPLSSSSKDHISLTDSAVETWLQSDVYCYEENFTSSSTEDNLRSCNIMAQAGNSAAAAVNSSSSSSNENLFLPKNTTKKSDNEILLRQQRKQKRKNRSKCLKNDTNISQRNDREGLKENLPPVGLFQTPTTTKSNTMLPPMQKYNCFNAKNSMCSSSSMSSNHSSFSSSASSSPAQSVNSSPSASPINRRCTDHSKRRQFAPPLKQFTKLNMKEQELVQQMHRYIIDPSLLRIYGFPVESVHYEGFVDIYKCLPKHLAEEAITRDNQRHHCHFYGRRKGDIINESDGLNAAACRGQMSHSFVDSGNATGESSPSVMDSDASEMGEEDSTPPLMGFYTPDGVYQVFTEYCNSTEKQCVRCYKTFQVNESGQYLSSDACSYHWGKLSHVYDGKCYVNVYSCCQGVEFSEGCCRHHQHVWNGVEMGLNGPYNGYLYTQKSNKGQTKRTKLYALDCEMSYTGLGLEVTKVTVIGYDGSVVYEHFVQPLAEIVDYNTRFSGVSAKDFLPGSPTSVKPFAQVQKDLVGLFDADTILVGHGLDNDLKALRLVHKTIVDTSIIFSHSTGYPYKRSLKNLTKSFLNRDIQCGDKGHSSFEDSQACLELMMWKIRKDLHHWSYN